MIRCKKRCGKKKWLEERNSQLFWQTKHPFPTGFRVLVWSQTTMSFSMLLMPCSMAPCPTTRVHNHAGLQRALLSLNGSDWHLGPPATCPAPSQSPCLPPPYSPTIVSHQPPNHKPPNSLTHSLARSPPSPRLLLTPDLLPTYLSRLFFRDVIHKSVEWLTAWYELSGFLFIPLPLLSSIVHFWPDSGVWHMGLSFG